MPFDIYIFYAQCIASTGFLQANKDYITSFIYKTAIIFSFFVSPFGKLFMLFLQSSVKNISKESATTRTFDVITLGKFKSVGASIRDFLLNISPIRHLECSWINFDIQHDNHSNFNFKNFFLAMTMWLLSNHKQNSTDKR